MCRSRSPESTYPIVGRLKYWKLSFPHLKSATFIRPRTFQEEDFVHMKDVETLDLRDTFKGLHSSYFKHLPNLTSLNIYGCHQFKFELQPAFLKLKRLRIDNYNAPSAEDLRQLTHLTYLNISNVCELPNYGLETLTNLRSLDIYNLRTLTDSVFDFLPNLEDLAITEGNLSSAGISKLKKLKTLRIISGKRMNSLEGLDTLPNLEQADFTYCPINDSDLKYISHVRRVVLYGISRILGHGFLDLKSAKYLAVYEMPLTDEGISHIQEMSAESIHMYRCRDVSINKKRDLVYKLSGRFHTD